MIEISIDEYELAMEDLCLGSVNFVDLIILVGLIIVATRWQEMEFSNALLKVHKYILIYYGNSDSLLPVS